MVSRSWCFIDYMGNFSLSSDRKYGIYQFFYPKMTVSSAWTVAADTRCVIVSGVPYGGLGNQLFQIAWAVRLAVQYNYRICLDRDSRWLRHGTSSSASLSTDTNGYFDTFWNTRHMIPVILIPSESMTTSDIHLHSNYEEELSVDPHIRAGMIFVSGFAQNLNLIVPTLRYLPFFLKLDQPDRQRLIHDRYGLDRQNSRGWTTIMLGVRRRDDFDHMKSMNDATYQACLDEAIATMASPQSPSDRPCVLVMIADVYDRLPQLVYPPSIKSVLYITEDDITQLYAGLCCECMILSESTFHYWIAVLRQSLGLNTHVIVPDDTDLTRRRLIFNTWKIVPQQST